MSKAVILLGDTTDHGGKVITAVDEYTHNGIPIAGKGDLVACLQCKGVFPIIQGADSLKYIPFIFQVAALLAAFTHPSHIVIYAP
ncbi:PAAR domain-containing protein, partial [Photorhabdus asymbiotica]